MELKRNVAVSFDQTFPISNTFVEKKKKSKGRDNQTNSVTVKSHEVPPSDVQLPRGSAGGKTNDHPRHAAGPRIIQIFYTTGFTADIGVHRIPPRAWNGSMVWRTNKATFMPDPTSLATEVEERAGKFLSNWP